MRIVCGTDFSDRAEEVGVLGALLAQRSGGDLTLIHVLDTRGSLFGPAAVLDAVESAARERLGEVSERLRALGATVSIELPAGWPDEALVAEAQRRDDALLVLPAVGRRDGPRVRLGKTCERTLRHTVSPMLVVRNAPPLIAWLRGEHPLRLLIAYDFTPQADAAVLFAGQLAALGACVPIAAYVGDPAREAARMGLLDTPAESQQRLHQEISRRLARALPSLPVEVVVSDDAGEPAARLAHLAERERADLIVTGSHQRGAVERLFSGSVSLDLMRDAGTNVLVVPGAVIAAATQLPPVVRRVLAATDLSPTGNQALAYALAITPASGEVIVVHVLSPNLVRDGQHGRPSDPSFAAEHAAVIEERRTALRALLAPLGTGQRAIRIELLEHERPERALLEAIEREAPDLVCVGTLGRTGASAAVLGSTAQALLRSCRRPLLMVQPQDR
ncbi:MAG: universal stress protein [Burkholderiaceae bacterium]|nr:universal stress protein [Burkholderiaceae bacterium]